MLGKGSRILKPARSEHRDKVRQTGVERCNIRKRSALLRTENRRRTVRPAERVMHIARDNQLHTNQPRRRIHRMNTAKVPPVALQRMAGSIEEAEAQGGEHAHSSVGARASAQRQHDPRRPQRKGKENRLAKASARRIKRQEPPVRQQSQTASIRHLHNSSDAVERDARLDGLSGRPRDHQSVAGEPRGDGGIHAAVTSVRQRQQLALHRSGGTEPCCQGVRHLAGGEAAFELVGRDEDAHRGSCVAHVRWILSRRDGGRRAEKARRRQRARELQPPESAPQVRPRRRGGHGRRRGCGPTRR
ncbi:hypothetical protein AHiyo8_42170 [Arthrobacter sp. Hiyo8]|nr:hypothetical protein AHiyo8_42170 [Arthrobacter sp. Hiyo8]